VESSRDHADIALRGPRAGIKLIDLTYQQILFWHRDLKSLRQP